MKDNQNGGGPKRAAVYARISRDRIGAGLGVDRQERDCRDLAGRLGWTVEVVRTDNDISAYSGKARPGYLALLEDIRAGRVDAVLVWHTDRLHRSPVELEAYIASCEAGKGRAAVETQTVKAGPLDLATPTGRMVARTLGNIAHFEVEHMVERQKAAKKQMREAGRWQGGPIPYGYRRADNGGLVIDHVEAGHIRSAAARVLAGDGLNAIARDLNAIGSRTPVTATRGGGNRWGHTTLRKVLCRATNAALIEHDGEIVGPSDWEPILDEATWRGVRAILWDPARRTTPGPAPRWLLTGVLVCGVCGGKDFRVAPVGTPRKPTYGCRAGGCVGRNAERLDGWVAELVRERLAYGDGAAALRPIGVDVAEVEGRRAGLRARLDALGTAYGAGEIDLQQMTAASRPLNAALRNVEDELAGVFRGSALEGLSGLDPGATWDVLPIERRRAVVRALFEKLVLLPVRGKPRPGWRRGMPWPADPYGLEVHWRTAP